MYSQLGPGVVRRQPATAPWQNRWRRTFLLCRCSTLAHQATRRRHILYVCGLLVNSLPMGRVLTRRETSPSRPTSRE